MRAGFVVGAHETYHRVPTGMVEDDEVRLATDAVARLRAAEYHVDCDADLDTDSRPASYLSLGASVAHLAERLREAATTNEAADALTELTAAHDGVLVALEEVLTATADLHDGLGQAADPYLSDEHLRIIRSDLSETRNQLADRYAPNPGRSACTEEVSSTEQERSAVYACQPPPRTLPVLPPPVAAGLRR